MSFSKDKMVLAGAQETNHSAVLLEKWLIMSSYVADVMSVDVFHAVTFYSQPGYLPPQQCNGG